MRKQFQHDHNSVLLYRQVYKSLYAWQREYCATAYTRLQSQLQYLSILCMCIHMHTWLSHHYMQRTENMYITSTYATSIVALLYNYTQ